MGRCASARDRIAAFNQALHDACSGTDGCTFLHAMTQLLVDAAGFLDERFYLTGDMFHMNTKCVKLALEPALEQQQ